MFLKKKGKGFDRSTVPILPFGDLKEFCWRYLKEFYQLLDMKNRANFDQLQLTDHMCVLCSGLTIELS